MSALASTNVSLPPRRLKLDTLIRLRWLAVLGQTLTVMFVHLTLGFPLPITGCMILIGLSAALNVYLRLRYPANLRLRETPAAVLLGYDIMQLTGLLFLTGGLQNPFSIMLIAPVTVSAAALPTDKTFFLGLLVILFATGLAVDHEPLPWFPGEHLELPLTYVGGLWISVVSALGFMGVYSARVTNETEKLTAALAATELVLAREQHLSQLDGLAAAAAHELGTPLATIALVAREIEREIPPGSGFADDIRLLRSQSDRCRDILKKLASLSTAPANQFATQPLTHLIEEVIAPHRDFGVALKVIVEGEKREEPVGTRSAAIHYGLGNIIENAVDFAATTVEITASWNAERVSIAIADDGPGFSPEIIEHLGEPYVTTREPEPSGAPQSEAGGLGLGFFIAKTLLERTGGTVSLANKRPPQSGAVVTVVWPRGAMEVAPGADFPRQTVAL